MRKNPMRFQNSNYKTLMNVWKKISHEVLEITKSLKFTQCKLEEKLAIVKNNISKVKSDTQVLEDYLLDPNEVSSKLIELEDRSRRKNLRFWWSNGRP